MIFRRLRHALYQRQQDVWSSWIQRRRARDFAGVTAFCLFVGYPRSGHSIVGAVLNAHRDAVIAHELDAPPLILSGCTRDELYARILARAAWFNLRGNTTNYRYAIPNQWQGRYRTLRVIGDKRAGSVTRCLAGHPEFFRDVRSLVKVPLRLVHVVRNPYDNIAAISIAERMSLEESVDFYFFHCTQTAGLDSLCPAEELVTLRHEDMIQDPAAAIADLCGRLGLDAYDGYIEDCRRSILRHPTLTRQKVEWSASLVREVEHASRQYPFLDGYSFEA
jgi:hypothetical protein